MRGRCQVKNCERANTTTKINEDFEDLIYGVCWQCGDKLKEIIGYELMNDFEFVLNIIRKELA